MGAYRHFQRQSRRAALCGVLAALGTVLLSLGGLVPFAAVALPMLAMLCLLPAVCDCGAKTALVQYAATAVLGLLLCPDPEASLLYVFLGWYPVLRPRLEKLPKALGTVLKTAIFCLAMVLMYTLLLYLFQMEAVIEEFAGYSAAAVIGLLAMGCVTFLLFDRALGMLAAVYRRKYHR